MPKIAGRQMGFSLGCAGDPGNGRIQIQVYFGIGLVTKFQVLGHNALKPVYKPLYWWN